MHTFTISRHVIFFNFGKSYIVNLIKIQKFKLNWMDRYTSDF